MFLVDRRTLAVGLQDKEAAAGGRHAGKRWRFQDRFGHPPPYAAVEVQEGAREIYFWSVASPPKQLRPKRLRRSISFEPLSGREQLSDQNKP